MYAPMKKGGMCKTRKYRNWISEHLPVFQQLARAQHFPVAIELFIVGGREFNSRNDCDNLIKPVQDLLVTAGILPDDTSDYVDHVEIRFIPGGLKSWPEIRIAVTEPEE
jgi:Holliday junction resolvase RusA-like endonuclease